MKHRIILLGVVCALPLVDAGAQQQRRHGRDSTNAATHAVNAGSGLLSNLLGLFDDGGSVASTSSAWCGSECGAPPARRNGRGVAHGPVAALFSAAPEHANEHSAVARLLQSDSGEPGARRSSEGAASTYEGTAGTGDVTTRFDVPTPLASVTTLANETPVGQSGTFFSLPAVGCTTCSANDDAMLPPMSDDLVIAPVSLVSPTTPAIQILAADDVPVIVNPEPSSIALMLLGLGAVGAAARRSRKRGARTEA